MLENITVLYIDDEQANRELVGFIVARRQSWQMIEAATGEEGLKKAIHHSPDLILLDISMPDIDGYDVLERLKTDERTKHIPVIAISGNLPKNADPSKTNSDFAAYLCKPVRLDQLYTTMDDVLE